MNRSLIRAITLLISLAALAWMSPALAEYRIGPADVLHVSVWKNEALSRSIPVRPDGKISLPLVNDVQAAGLTPMELRERLAQKLSDYMPNPEISVIVEEVHSYSVSVIGEVNAPGHYELKSHATVLSVLAQAGGFTEFASRSRVAVLRPDGQGMRRIRFDYDKVVTSSDAQGNVLLQPGDIVLVP